LARRGLGHLPVNEIRYMSTTDLNLLEVFTLLYEEGNVTKAAERTKNGILETEVPGHTGSAATQAQPMPRTQTMTVIALQRVPWSVRLPLSDRNFCLKNRVRNEVRTEARFETRNEVRNGARRWSTGALIP